MGGSLGRCSTDTRAGCCLADSSGRFRYPDRPDEPAGLCGRWHVLWQSLAVALLTVGACWAAAAIAAGQGPAAAAVSHPAPHFPAHTPRIITLAPSATELVFAAGGGPDIVATVLSSDYPPAARDIPRIGDGIQFSDETILALHPTLVVGWLPTDASRRLAQRLHSLDVPLIYVNPQRLDDIPILIRHLGGRLGTRATAQAAAHQLEQRIQALQPAAPPPQTVFIEISSDPLFTLGRDPLIDDLLARCGGINPYASLPVAAPQVSVESVLHLNPRVLIVSPYGHETLATRTAWWARHGLDAAHQGRIYAIDPDWLHRPGPRLVDAAEALCKDLRDSRALEQAMDRAADHSGSNGLSLQVATCTWQPHHLFASAYTQNDFCRHPEHRRSHLSFPPAGRYRKIP